MNFNYFVPAKIIFGAGRLDELGELELPGKKAMVVISAGGSMRRHGYLERVLSILAKRGVKSIVYDKILPNPVLEHVDEGAELCRKERCDFILGLGGGSSIDSAKAIAVAAPNPGTFWDYVSSETGGGKPLPERPLPVVAVTTTAGTGTESDPWMVITNPQAKEKVGFGNDYTFPVLSIVDPELMLTVPPGLTAYQGMDAFFHSVEGYISVNHQPSSDYHALDAVRLISENLPKAVRNGSDMEARTLLAWANTQAGFVECLSSNTAHHSMEHAVSAYYPEVPHGAGLILISPGFFGFMEEKVPDRFKALAEVMGADTFVDGLKKLIKDIGMDKLSFSDYGITEGDARRFAEKSFSSMPRLYTLTPYPFTVDEVTEIFEAVIE